MAKKISRRNFLKGTGKVTATLATIWAVGGSFELPEVEVTEKPEPDEPDTCYDCGSGPCHPYYCVGGVTICHTWEDNVW